MATFNASLMSQIGRLMGKRRIRGKRVTPMPARKKCTPGFGDRIHYRYKAAKARVRRDHLKGCAPCKCRCGNYVIV